MEKAKKRYTILREDGLFQPAERPTIAVFGLGLTLGFVWAVVVVLVTGLGISHRALSAVNFLEVLYPGYARPLDMVDLVVGVIQGFLHGFLFGATIGYIYFRIRGPYPCGVKIRKPGQITQVRTPVTISPGAEGPQPYTILILANPLLESEFTGRFRRDPILDEPRLFQAKVACIIGSLASNELIGKEFLDRMRIMTLFDPELAKEPFEEDNALCRELAFDVIIDPRQRVYPDESLINETKNVRRGVPERKVKERLIDFLRKWEVFYKNDKPLVDVVFAVTASLTHTRSSAAYTFDDDDPGSLGPTFTLEMPKSEDGPFVRHHAPYPLVPGLIAYSAWDERLKTPVHEFAHAMSSTTNGLIYDEYNDEFHKIFESLPVINKRIGDPQWDRNHNRYVDLNELPATFSIYRKEGGSRQSFFTDKSRVKPKNWLSFVPATEALHLPCTMDASGDINRFDMMIEAFMRDRLEAKMNRR